jgi:non-specific serine/threonine protein kinase/serine/threonine-protein kinase
VSDLPAPAVPPPPRYTGGATGPASDVGADGAALGVRSGILTGEPPTAPADLAPSRGTTLPASEAVTQPFEDAVPARVGGRAVLGPYHLLHVLGEGGMGIVYAAEERGALRRRVALKVVRAHLAGPEVIARFEAERQALAVMDHPGIAKVLNAGTTGAGQPWFAMELVHGQPITAYCDAHRLRTAARVRLFVDVCHAVQHAHYKGVVHRDLKPSNLLVAEADGAPRPVVIDFGIAKALGQQLSEHTLVTRAGEPLGTLDYMSPEQADASGLDVDTRTDVYALGVVLYELLVGLLPVDRGGVSAPVFLARLASGESTAPRPSERLRALGAGPPASPRCGAPTPSGCTARCAATSTGS